LKKKGRKGGWAVELEGREGERKAAPSRAAWRLRQGTCPPSTEGEHEGERGREGWPSRRNERSERREKKPPRLLEAKKE
jgi:hypothetical protein